MSDELVVALREMSTRANAARGASWEHGARCATILSDAASSIESLQAKLEAAEYTLLGVMHSVDKWLDGDELDGDEVNRACTMREKTLRLLEAAERERDEARGILHRLHEAKDKLFAEWEAAVIACNKAQDERDEAKADAANFRAMFEHKHQPCCDALGEIAALSGCPEWDYPGQVVRDAKMLVERLDEARALLREVRSAYVYPDTPDWARIAKALGE